MLRLLAEISTFSFLPSRYFELRRFTPLQILLKYKSAVSRNVVEVVDGVEWVEGGGGLVQHR